jgi:hypothetical protein
MLLVTAATLNLKITKKAPKSLLDSCLLLGATTS